MVHARGRAYFPVRKGKMLTEQKIMITRLNLVKEGMEIDNSLC